MRKLKFCLPTRQSKQKWTVGSPIQGLLDAIELMRKKRPFDASQVAKVVVKLEPSVANVVDNRDIPDICLQHMVAIMLLDKTATFKAAHDVPRMKDVNVLRERAKVQLIGDESLKQYLPVRVALVEVTLADGTDLIAPIVGSEKTKKLVEIVFSLERLASVREFRSFLQPA
jgi:2-methylcitrate dehydratase PrpD